MSGLYNEANYENSLIELFKDGLEYVYVYDQRRTDSLI